MQYADVTANSMWRTAAILKTPLFGYISTIYCPINAKFGVKNEDAQSLSNTGHVTRIPYFEQDC